MATKAKIYQFKITLKGIRPPIWRRFEVASNITFLELHEIIQVVMGWQNYHLHQFFIDGTYITDRATMEEAGYGDADTAKSRLNKFVRQEGQKFTYEYDFGDSWGHELLLEKILEPEAGVSYPRCLKGKRACPPEDCGGFWGYEHLLEVIQDPEHPEYEDMVEWLEDELDPEEFDLAEVNKMLSSVG